MFSLLRTLALCSLLAAQITPTFAQEDLHPSPSETIHLKVGDIFEILPIHDIPEPTYTWILTQDRTFLEANRAPSFRKRLIQPGLYTLYAEITSADGSRRISRTISLDYSARQPGETVPPAAVSDDSILVRTEPPVDDQGRMALAAGTQLVELLPVNPDVVPLALDLDLSKDADGDGKADNDIQADDTFFHSDATPLFLWITDDPLTTHSISVTAAAANGARTQKIDILNSEIAKAQGIIQSPVHIETESTGERAYIFNAVFENPDAAAGQLLYQWQFGDGQQSLVTKPDHSYAEDGTYTVSLLIRNLRDGSEVASTSLALNVMPTNAEPSSSEASSESSEPTITPTQNSGGGIGSILLSVGLFILSLLIGIGIIFLIGKLRKNKTTLADKLENIEKTMVTSPVQQTPTLTINPPAAAPEKKTQEPPASIAEREKELDVEPPAPEPVVKKENAPSWLTATTPKQAQNSTTPTPPLVTPTPKPAAPAPIQSPKPATPPTAVQAPTWLQTPAAAPAPVATPKASQVTTEQKESPEAPTSPAWLQPARAGSDGQPTTPVSTSVPPAPKQTQAPVQAPKPVATPTPFVPPSPKPQPQTPVVTPVTPPKPAVSTPVIQPQIQKPQQPVQPTPPTVVPFNPATLPNPKPAQQPAPFAPVIPTPTPTPVVPTPAPVQPAPKPVPAAPAPVQTVPAPIPAPQPVTPPATPTPVTPVEMDIPRSGDQPIAIIRAESLNPPKEA